MMYRPELENAALLRELHVYGSLVPVGKDAESEEWQHRNYGKELLLRAEEIARGAGFRQPRDHERDRGAAILPAAGL